MNVAIPADLELFVQNAISDGTYRDPGEVVREALRLLARRDQVLRDVRAGIQQLDGGQYTEYDEDSLQQFLTDIRAEHQKRSAEK